MLRPLFSIITVTYNAAATVGRTIESVMSQTCNLYEHIIIDGGSTDGTLDLVKECGSDRLQVISEPDHGIYDAMNKGMALATGEYYIFLNAGDKFHSDTTLQLYADAIMDDDFPGVVYGQTDLVDDTGHYLGKRHLSAPAFLTVSSMKNGMVVCHQAMAVYNKVAALYDLGYKYSSDYDWVINCLKKSRRNVYIDEVLVDYLSEGATTANHRHSLAERFKIMCKHFGAWPTMVRHVKFLFRYIYRRKNASNIQ